MITEEGEGLRMYITPIPPMGAMVIIKDAKLLLLPLVPLPQGLLHITCINDDTDPELDHLTLIPPPMTIATTQDERWQEQLLVLLLQVLLRTRSTSTVESPDPAQ